MQLGILTNQLLPEDLIPSPIDVMIFQTNNSPQGIDWQNVINASKAKRVLLNVEGINIGQYQENIHFEENALKPRRVADGAFCYYEFPKYTLTAEEILETQYTLGVPIFPLFRIWEKELVDNTLMSLPSTTAAGGVFEVGVNNFDIVVKCGVRKWVDYLSKNRREPIILLPPGAAGPYAHNTLTVVKYLKKACRYFKDLTIILAVYNRFETKIDFKRLDATLKLIRG